MVSVSDRQRIFKLWYLAVTECTKRALTIGDDKLPALSGIVNVFNQALDSGEDDWYKAGMLKQDVMQFALEAISMRMKVRELS